MKIGIAFNLKRQPKPDEPQDKYAEYDERTTIDAIKKALESGGHAVVLLEADENFVEKVKEEKPHFVFNIAEGISGPGRESYVPVVLDMLGIPYTGSNPLTLAITLDKGRTNEILRHHGIPVPDWWISYDADEVPNVKFPVIVKPNAEGSSKGIRNNSIAYNERQLKKIVRYVIETYNQPAIIQRYLAGREFTVSIIGNNPPRVLPIVEVTYDYLPKEMNRIDSYEVKWIWDSPNNPIDSIVCPAKIDKKLEESIKDVALRTYRALGCVDFCRIDMRLDEKNVPNVLDVNALPGLIPDPRENSRFPKAAYAAGYTYEKLINEILHHAIERVGKKHMAHNASFR